MKNEFIHPNTPCRFVMKEKGGWIYGHVVSNGKENIRIPEGIEKTYEEALARNEMAEKGLPRIGHRHQPNFWD